MPHRGYRTGSRTVAGLATVTLFTAGLAGCSQDGQETVLKDFLSGWRSGNLSAVGFVGADGGKVAANDVSEQLHRLSGDLANQSLVLTTVGEPKTTGDVASSTVKLDWTLPGGAAWSYDSTVRLTKRGTDGWRVVWEPAIVHSDLATGDKLRIRRSAATRGAILDGQGRPLVTRRPVVVVGVSPAKIDDLSKLRRSLNAAFRKVGATVDMSNLAERVKNAEPGDFIELLTLRQADYDKIRDAVRPLSGTVFRTEQRDLAPTRAFARALLGTADQATREDIDANPQVVAQGDIVGHGGLQQRYDTKLRGTSAISVVIAREAADGTVTDSRLFATEPVAGTPIRISLDTAIQNAADQASAAEKQPSSLIAIRVSDGSVVAVSNGPDGGTVDTALTGQVPPGSTFKTVSAYGLLQRRIVGADTVVDCPKTLAVSGREFKNADGEVLGRVPFHVDYAKSCNTAFVSLSSRLGATGLRDAATALGLGVPWDIGTEAFSGKISSAGSPTELAAATFGQGATAVSPIAMAGVAAAVARGRFKQPRLVLDPAPAKPAADGAALDAGAVSALRSMMREVVTRGTGAALRDVEGEPVFGKTGTAEFDDQAKDTHSWFIGYQGDVAFAAMVQKGGAGSEAAVPLVERFLNELNR